MIVLRYECGEDGKVAIEADSGGSVTGREQECESGCEWKPWIQIEGANDSPRGNPRPGLAGWRCEHVPDRWLEDVTLQSLPSDDLRYLKETNNRPVTAAAGWWQGDRVRGRPRNHLALFKHPTVTSSEVCFDRHNQISHDLFNSYHRLLKTINGK